MDEIKRPADKRVVTVATVLPLPEPVVLKVVCESPSWDTPVRMYQLIKFPSSPSQWVEEKQFLGGKVYLIDRRKRSKLLIANMPAVRR